MRKLISLLLAFAVTPIVVASLEPTTLVPRGRTLSHGETHLLYGGQNHKCCGPDTGCIPQPANSQICTAYTTNPPCANKSYQYNPSSGSGRRCNVDHQTKTCTEEDPDEVSCLVQANCSWTGNPVSCVTNEGSEEVWPRWICSDNCSA